MKRGDIYYADLSPVVGSEQGGVRPVLIVQNDTGNRYSPTAVSYTHLLPAGDDGLYFVEKVAFQEPYRLTKFESRAALKSYLMAKYDTGWGPVSYTHLDVYKRQPLR